VGAALLARCTDKRLKEFLHEMRVRIFFSLSVAPSTPDDESIGHSDAEDTKEALLVPEAGLDRPLHGVGTTQLVAPIHTAHVLIVPTQEKTVTHFENRKQKKQKRKEETLTCRQALGL
jgi:hypothetical protein